MNDIATTCARATSALYIIGSIYGFFWIDSAIIVPVSNWTPLSIVDHANLFLLFGAGVVVMGLWVVGRGIKWNRV